MEYEELENRVVALAVCQVNQTKAFLELAAMARGKAAGRALEAIEGLSLVIAYALYGISRLLPREIALSEDAEAKENGN